MYLCIEDERKKIVVAVDAIDKRIAIVALKKGLLNNLFQSLLQQLMTAQIRVNDLDLPELGCECGKAGSTENIQT
jgi:hypothetical protein